jgi:uncharacterized protein with HEPN domain
VIDERDRVYLLHILEAIGWINSYTTAGQTSFLGERMIQDAVIRNLEVIGEAVKNLSPELRVEHPDIPWQRIAGLRDVLIHHYFGVNLNTVWGIVENRLPELEAVVRALLEIADGKAKLS